MRIRTKLFLTNSAVVILLLASLTFLMESHGRNSMLKKMMENTGYSLSQLTENVDKLLGSYEQLADFLYMEDLLQDRLMHQYDSFPDAHRDYFDHVLPLLTALRSSKDIASLMLYTDNASFHVGDIRPLSELPSLADEARCSRRSGPVSDKRWSVLAGEEGELMLRLTQRLNHLYFDACQFAVIDMEADIVADLIRKENDKTNFVVYLPDGSIVLDNFRSGDPAAGDRGSAEGYWFYPELLSAEGDRVVYRDEQAYLLAHRTIDSRNSVRGIGVVSLVPLDELEAETKEIRSMAVILFLAALSVFVVANILISTGLTRRLTELSLRLRRTNMDNLQPIPRITGNDEVSQLGHMFNGMVQRMQRLLREVYDSELGRKELELKTKESELYALQTQINPHYLFNTLNAIRGNLLENGDRANAEIVNLLARSFRNVLGKGGGLVTLAEELDIVETYLKIQSFRFSDRLNYRIEVPKPLHRVKVPKLALQTLVENAIIHGLEPKEDGTTIAIRSVINDQGELHVIVEDDGLGIPPERLQEVRSGLNDAGQSLAAKHIGLRNVHQRLKISLGEPYGILIESEVGRGTRLIMVLPLQDFV
ncbi:sensor histidine kinase [Paenibacillus sp. J5C_2022]|uniref:sensor histidine kinase n=1 Tax=Paenibacillus sp. J5C2022 TaxID=2977129 RepID=UPI0021CED165|nr:sensor histidine kinase [Paenibacillus sp. J5C2022]MCU6712185.1 sensor histidine kinase [Paenibacillus sp. J5C2022]